MTARVLCILSCCALVISCAATVKEVAPVKAADAKDAYLKEGYKLVWSDEFDKPGRPDPTKWTYETGFVRNNEAQWYQPENARVENGMLIIEAKREKKPNPNYTPNGRGWKQTRQFAEYTSACLKTQGLASWKYGRFEMRGRIDTRPGMWPAWWTLGTDGRWPNGGEIDIMEYYRNMLLANAAWGSANPHEPEWSSVKTPLEKLGAGWSDKFHVWRMDWNEKELLLSCDGVVLNKVNVDETVNKDDGKNPFHYPQYMLINLAIGGDAGGDPSKTTFPARFEVDYVRVYQK